MLPTSYQCGLLQAKSSRLFRSAVSAALEPHQLSVAEWNLLVQLQSSDGMRHAKIAGILQVEAPLVTALVKQLERKRLVRRISDPQDSRAKCLFLTRKAVQLLPCLETLVCSAAQELLAGIPPESLAGYFAVMEAIVARTAPEASPPKAAKA